MAAQSSPAVTGVRFEHLLVDDAIGIDIARPRLSWKLIGVTGNVSQERYEITAFSQKDDAVPSHKATVNSNSSTLVAWPFQDPLKSRQGLFVRIRAWLTGSTELSLQSEPAYVEAGLLDRSDWISRRICSPASRDITSPRPEELYRKEFIVKQAVKVQKARLYITAQGLYEAEVSGNKVGDHFLSPGWTPYNHRLSYQTFDVLHLLLPNEERNCLAVRVAEGWFCGRLGWEGGVRNIWGDQNALIAQLELSYSDGSVEVVCTNDSWDTTSGPVQLAELYNGEKYDSTLEEAGWSSPGMSHATTTRNWSKAVVLEDLALSVALVGLQFSPTRRLRVVNPVRVLNSIGGGIILDFGQNIVGYTRFSSIRGVRGRILSLFHAEILERGECSRRPLRQADALDTYTFKGDPEGESWQPRFTFHGFQFVQVDGLPESTDPLTSFEAVVCHTEMELTGNFSCSNTMLNDLHSNVVRGMQGNFLGVPTDCPQRDERCGWTGDIALFAPTALFLYDCTGMLSSWLCGLAAEQKSLNGTPPLVSPDVIYAMNELFPLSRTMPTAIWGDVTILVPWALYQASGDIDILEKQYNSMVAWLEAIPRDDKHGRRLWAPHTFQFGDWLDPSAPHDMPADGKTDNHLVANAFLIHSLELMVQISDILGHREHSTSWSAEWVRLRKEFCDEYISSNGRLVSDSQTAYAIAICFDLFETPQQTAAGGERLSWLVRRNSFRIGTGFAGTPFVCEALVRSGYAQVAYRMLLEESCPSWLYPVTMGATTIWERWDSMLPNGLVNPGEMTSFNHYALGSVATFMHERLGGLRCLAPGWKRARAEPIMGAEFTEATVSHLSPHGEVSCSWKIVRGNQFEMSVNVPLGTTMEVILPNLGTSSDSPTHIVGPGKHRFSVSYQKAYSWPPEAIPWTSTEQL